MKQMPLLLCALLYSSIMTGCGNDFQYDGTFDEAVFAQICQDVHIRGTRVTVPGTLEDWGEAFSADLVLEGEEAIFYMVTIDDSTAALVIYDNSGELTEETLKTMPYCMIAFGDVISENTDDSGVADLVIGDSAESITNTFGEPTEIEEADENGVYNYKYAVSEEQFIVFLLHDGILSDIVILNQSSNILKGEQS